MKAQADRKGVRFHITREMIREYRKLPLDERLRSLQEQIILSYMILTPERRRAWEKFRRGDL